jgi:hypothetical protein
VGDEEAIARIAIAKHYIFLRGDLFIRNVAPSFRLAHF